MEHVNKQNGNERHVEIAVAVAAQADMEGHAMHDKEHPMEVFPATSEVSPLFEGACENCGRQCCDESSTTSINLGQGEVPHFFHYPSNQFFEFPPPSSRSTLTLVGCNVSNNNLFEEDCSEWEIRGKMGAGCMVRNGGILNLINSKITGCSITNSDTTSFERPPAYIEWRARFVGSPDRIEFVFSNTVQTLQRNDITITRGVGNTGYATRGNLSGSGNRRSLTVSNVRDGTVRISIDRYGIARESQTVTIVSDSEKDDDIEPFPPPVQPVNQMPAGAGAGLGGGLMVLTGGTANLYSGEISNNTARNGGGVAVAHGGVFNMAGGSISYNAVGQDGGGVWLSAGGCMQMMGGDVSFNTAFYNSGGIDANGQGGGAWLMIQTGAIVANSGRGNFNMRSWIRGSARRVRFTLQGGRIDRIGKLVLVGNIYSANQDLIIVNALRPGIFVPPPAPAGGGGGGRCIPLSTLILTPEGYRKLSDLKVGDEVISKTTFNRVTVEKIWHVWRSETEVPLHRIFFTDGSEFVCNLSHIFEKRYRGPSSFVPAEVKDYMPLGTIRAGDTISAMGGWKTVRAVERTAPDYIGEIYLERDYYYYAGEGNITSWTVSGQMMNKHMRNEEHIAEYGWPIVRTSKGPWILPEYAKVVLNSWRLVRTEPS